jgi:hypothetical protein
MISQLCRSGVRSSGLKSPLLLGLIANKFRRRIQSFGQAGGGRGTGVEPSPRTPACPQSEAVLRPLNGRSSAALAPAASDPERGIRCGELLITTEAMVAEVPKKNAGGAGGMPPGGGGMGGMGGMDF